MRISIICTAAALLLANTGCHALRGDETSRFRNTNRTAYRQDATLSPVAEQPNSGISWGGDLSPR